MELMNSEKMYLEKKEKNEIKWKSSPSGGNAMSLAEIVC